MLGLDDIVWMEQLHTNTVTRDELFITSKVWHDSHGANKVDAAFSESLKKLQLDYLRQRPNHRGSYRHRQKLPRPRPSRGCVPA